MATIMVIIKRPLVIYMWRRSTSIAIEISMGGTASIIAKIAEIGL
jgi:hypothetical protein